MLAKGDINIDALSKTEGFTASYVTRLVRLAFLAPEVIDAALNGEFKASISGRTLVNLGSVPEQWSDQRDRFISAS